MTKYKKYFLIFIFCLINNNSSSESIVYANLDLVVQNSDVGKKIFLYYENKNNVLLKKINDEKKIILEKEKSLISQKNILQENEYSKKVESLKLEVSKFNKSNNEKLNSMKIEKDRVLKSFLTEINNILKEFAETNNIDIILSSNQMLIGKSNLDVSDELLKVVNSKIKNFEIKNVQ